jgi:excisionase family DNA binding protein
MKVHQRRSPGYRAGVDAPQEPIWLGTQEAARHLGITARTLYRLIDTGEIPAYKLGRVLRIKLSDVDRFLEGARVQPGDLEHLYPERKRSDAQPGSDA